jgi:hypothetical protein
MEQPAQAVTPPQIETKRVQHTPHRDQRASDGDTTITIANYLLNRLAETGVTVRLILWNTPTAVY